MPASSERSVTQPPCWVSRDTLDQGEGGPASDGLVVGDPRPVAEGRVHPSELRSQEFHGSESPGAYEVWALRGVHERGPLLQLRAQEVMGEVFNIHSELANGDVWVTPKGQTITISQAGANGVVFEYRWSRSTRPNAYRITTYGELAKALRGARCQSRTLTGRS